jgi:hypothetical protein
MEISRPGQSKFVDQITSEIQKSAGAMYFDRVNMEFKKEDPFKDVALPNVWKRKGNKLLRRKNI